MHDKFISDTARKGAWQRFNIFAILNGFSFGLLADNVLVLFALNAGVAPWLSGVLVSFMFVSMPFMIPGKYLMARYGAAKTHGIAWALRNLCALCMGLTPFLYTLGANSFTVTVFITLFAFGFYAFRAAGITAHRPLIGEITEADDRGRFLGGFGVRFNASYLCAIALFALIMRIQPSLGIFQLLIVIGCIFGLISAAVISSIPETDGPRTSASQPMKHSLVQLWHTRRQRRLLFAQMAGRASFAMTIPFSMVALKHLYKVSDFNALLFVLVQTAASLGGAMLLGRIIDRTGPRPLLMVFGGGFLCIALLWTITPSGFVVAFTGLIFFLGGLCKSGMNLGLNHYFLDATSRDDRVVAGMLVQVTGGASAGLAGSLVSGGLLKALNTYIESPLQQYRIYFGVIAVCILLFLWLLSRIEPIPPESASNEHPDD